MRAGKSLKYAETAKITGCKRQDYAKLREDTKDLQVTIKKLGPECFFICMQMWETCTGMAVRCCWVAVL